MYLHIREDGALVPQMDPTPWAQTPSPVGTLDTNGLQ